MTLFVKISSACAKEKEYILELLLGEYLGISYNIDYCDTSEVAISDDNGKIIVLPDVFFQKAQHNWLSNECMPTQPIKNIKINLSDANNWLTSPDIPVLYGNNETSGNVVTINEDSIKLSIDIFGTCFFILSGIEEVINTNRDLHSRFCASSSIAFQEGYLDRPLVNEYLEILWNCMKVLWPGLERKNRYFRIFPTHDVDRPYAYLPKNVRKLAVNMLGDVLVRHKPGNVVNRLVTWRKVQSGSLSSDPLNTFDSIIHLGEKHSLKSTFYFLAGHTNRKYDGKYSLQDSEIKELIKKIADRGHNIGLHGSYNSYINHEMLETERNCLLSVCRKHNILVDKVHARQHFLRFNIPSTFKILDESGIDSDSSMAFADYAGFRRGVCYEYPVYDVVERRKLHIREKPLIVMECSVIDECYMGFGKTEKALNHMLLLKERCRKYNGDFVFLWHNTRYIDPIEYGFAEELMKN